MRQAPFLPAHFLFSCIEDGRSILGFLKGGHDPNMTGRFSCQTWKGEHLDWEDATPLEAVLYSILHGHQTTDSLDMISYLVTASQLVNYGARMTLNGEKAVLAILQKFAPYSVDGSNDFFERPEKNEQAIQNMMALLMICDEAGANWNQALPVEGESRKAMVGFELIHTYFQSITPHLLGGIFWIEKQDWLDEQDTIAEDIRLPILKLSADFHTLYEKHQIHLFRQRLDENLDNSSPHLSKPKKPML